MKILSTQFLIIPAIFLAVSLMGQQTVYQPTGVRTPVYFGITPPLRDMQQIAPTKTSKDEREVPNKVGRREFFNLPIPPFTLPEDPVWQKENGSYLPANASPIQNFEGIPNLSGVYPPDPQGEAGPNHYVQVVNSKFAVYSKSGTLLLGPSSLSTIWAGIPAPWQGTNSGDPVVVYDQAADRWFISQFSLPSSTQYAELVAVSVTNDPTGSWYQYVYQYGDRMPDYPKFGIWPDGYYMSVNLFIGGATWGGVSVSVMDRTAMLAGNPTATMIYFDLGAAANPESMLPSDWDGTVAPPAGAPNYFTYLGVSTLHIYEFHTDWVTPANSTFTLATNLTPAPFDQQLCLAIRGRCIHQPSTCTSVQLESLSDRLMFKQQYRNFGSYQTMVNNHTVDVDGTGHAGIRWYEIRNSGSGWTIYQQGTYAPDASHRWMGSIAMNGAGDIALGYSVSDATSTFPSIRYTGRRATDPLGTMTITEQSVIDGGGCQTGTSARWGDYSGMCVDPTDDNTFWCTTEYILLTGTATWKTRIASFIFDNSPSIITLPPTSVTTSSATLNGTVNPNGLATTYYFQWGPTISYGNTTLVTSAGSGSLILPVSVPISGLSPGTTYHYRMAGTNSDGTSYGGDQVFNTDCPPATLPFQETFPSTTMPPCWSQVDHQGNGQIWLFGTITGYSPNPALTGNYAFLNSDAYGPLNAQNADLISPRFDLSAYSIVTLSFDHYYRAYSGQTGTLSYSIDNGSTWTQIQQFTTTSLTNPVTFHQGIPGVAGQSQVKFRWNFTGTWGWYWAIDNVEVTGIPTNRSLNNITIGNQTIACYNAAQILTIAETGPFLVETGGNVTLIAGQKILFMPGTTVQPGGYMWAYISTQYCTNPTSGPQNPVNLENLISSDPLSETTLFKVYPNPTPGKFTLELSPDAIVGQALVSIYGMTGELVLKETILIGKGQALKKEFSLENRPPGIYIIRVISGNNSNAAKIVRQ